MSLTGSIKEFGHRRVIMPLLGQLKQGSSADELASSLAWGSALSLFPILGTSTILCGIVGYFRKLNHVALQLVNYLAFPLHVALLVPFLKAGDWVFGVEDKGYAFPVLMHEFEKSPIRFVQHYGGSLFRAVAVWALVIPIPALVVRYATLPWLRRLSAKIAIFKETRAEKPEKP